MRILVIDNNIDRDWWGAANLRRFCVRHPGAEVTTRRAPQGDLPRDWTRFDRIVISGSRTSALDDAPWIDALMEGIRGAVDRGQPILGVCYGHQITARALGGKERVGKAATPEVGWTRIRVLAKSRLFAGLPEEFTTFSSHFDEVARLPEGTIPTARSEDCLHQGFEVEGKPVFGIQFHPEKNLDEAARIFDELRGAGRGKILREPERSAKLFDPAIGERIFQNFLSL